MATYTTILTNNGKALLANAVINNKVNFSHIALGDGNGSVPTPDETRTALVHETTRIAVNAVRINPTITNRIEVEIIVPTTNGGYTIREIGVYAGTTLVAIGNFPPTYKPTAMEGGAREMAIKVVFDVQNANVVQVTLDNSLIYATQKWTDDNYIRRNELINNLTTADSTKPLTAAQGKTLQDTKLDKTANAVSATKLQTARNIALTGAVSGNATFDGSSNITINTAIDTITIPMSNDANAYKKLIQAGTTTDYGFLAVGNTGENSGYVEIATTDDGNEGIYATQYGLSGSIEARAKLLNQNHDTELPGTVYARNIVPQNPIAVANGGTGNSSGIAPSASKIISTDNRTIQPKNVDKISAKLYLYEYLGYKDLLTLNSWTDSSAGKINALAFNKSFAEIYHYQANIDAESWEIKKQLAYIDSNVATASKLQTSRQIFGQSFDGTADVDGTITINTGLIKSNDNYRYIDIGKTFVDRINFGTYLGRFNFIDTQTNNMIYLDVPSKYIDCTANNANQLKTARTINIAGAVTGNAVFNGSSDITINTSAHITTVQNLSQGSNGYWTTADFINWLQQQGAFDTYIWSTKQMWYYDGGKTINDTGCGDIHLAGAVIEVIGYIGEYTIRIITAPSSPNTGKPKTEFVYLNHGPQYNPGWYRNFNTTDIIPVANGGTGNSNGIAPSATKLQTARNIAIIGDATGNATFDGTANININTTLASTGVSSGTYRSVTVDAKGRVTAGDNVQVGLVTATTSTGTSNQATSNSNTYLNVTERVGTSTTSVGTSTQITGAGTVSVASDTAGRLIITGSQNITGNAATASKLQTPRNIAIAGAVSGSANFDGSGNITISTTATSALGVGQSYQDVSSSRSLDTNYTNSTGRPIWVSIIAKYGNSPHISIYVDNILVARSGTTYNSGSPEVGCAAIVPAGSSYRVEMNTTSSTVTWVELR